MHWVTTQLNISEKEYFGLLWEDKKGEKVGDCLFITGYQFSISSFKLKVIQTHKADDRFLVDVQSRWH